MLDPIAERRFCNADVFDQLFHALRFNRSCLICAPHRSIERKVALNQTSPHGDRNHGRDQPHFVTGITDRAIKLLDQLGNHAQVQLFRLAGISTGRVRNDQVIQTAKQADGVANLFHGRHTGRENNRTSSLEQAVQQSLVSQACRGHFICNWVKSFEKINRSFVPNRSKPVNAKIAAQQVNLAVFVFIKFDMFTIRQIGHISPWRFTHPALFLKRNADSRCPFLEFHSVNACCIS